MNAKQKTKKQIVKSMQPGFRQEVVRQKLLRAARKQRKGKK